MNEASPRPLSGLTFWNTREASAAPALTARLTELGGRVIERPTIAHLPPVSWAPFDEALARLTPGTWIVFTSATAVRFAVGRIEVLGAAAADLARASIAALGQGTEEALKAWGLPVAIVPRTFQQEGLLEALRPRLEPGQPVWLPRAEEARTVLEEGLAAAGAAVRVTPVYRTVVPAGGLGAALDALLSGKLDWILFTSSSTVTNLFDMLPDANARRALRKGPAIACLGSITAETARGLGLTVTVVPQRQDLDGLVAALVAHLAGHVSD